MNIPGLAGAGNLGAIGYHGVAIQHNLPAVVEVTSEVFFMHFQAAIDIATDEIDFIDKQNESIKSTEMDDCITLFAIERRAGVELGISKIIGYHIASLSDLEEIKEKFDNVAIEDDLNYEIYLIGGNKASTAAGDLLDIIRAAIPKVFQNYNIAGEHLNLKEAGDQYISASMQMNGALTFCRHERLDT